MSVFKYRKILTGSEMIQAGEQYSFICEVDAPDLSEYTLKLALDVLIDRLKYNYPIENITYILWQDPLYSSIEILFVFRESPVRTLNWFFEEVKVYATDVYLALDLVEVAVFLAKFPWWIWALLAALGAVAVGEVIKKKKGG